MESQDPVVPGAAQRRDTPTEPDAPAKPDLPSEAHLPAGADTPTERELPPREAHLPAEASPPTASAQPQASDALEAADRPEPSGASISVDAPASKDSEQPKDGTSEPKDGTYPPGLDLVDFPSLNDSTTSDGTDSAMTVAVAFVANLVIAIAKTVAAGLTGSASLVAEAAHSWADAGNEVFLVVANRRSRRPPEPTHPHGFGREAYVWSLFAALGLFIAGAAVSVTHGVQELFNPEPASDFLIGYIVLAVSFVLEATSFLQSLRQAGPEARAMDRDLIEHVLATSDPTLRAVFAEDAAALIGLLIAAGGLGLHQITGSSTPDAIGSILVGLLLGAVAAVLINRNRRFLVGEEADPRVRTAVIKALLELPEVARVTYLRLEIIGPKMITLVGDVDLTGDDRESHLAVRLRALEAKISESPVVVGAVLSLSAPDEASLTE